MQKKLAFFSIFLLLSFSILAQIPTGYYDTAIGKKKAELKTALHLKIKNANVPSYGSGANSTWAAFAKTDVRPSDGTVWDMYSNNHVAFDGNSAASGMNIEHSFAKSWWGGGRQAAQDVMHLAPSNITANSSKGSWPMAVVDGTTTFNNGVIKVGKSSSRPGGEITAWEPADEYKGDFARAYMYMVTAYEDYATIWTGNSVNQLDNNTYPVFEQWTTDLLLLWGEQDPVSEKEINRNNEVYKIQGNRNPYIDYPLMAQYVWGRLQDVPFTPDGTVNYPYISTPTNGSTVDFGKVAFQQMASKRINLKALNLTGDLSLAITGTNAADFSVVSTVTKAEAEAGKDIVINYSAQTVGSQSVQLTISGGGATSTLVSLKAISSDEFIALPASDISSNGFTANWAVSANATGYTLNVFSLKSNGTTKTKTLLEEDFLKSLGAWTSETTNNYTAIESENVRLASSGSDGKITSPALDLSTSGVTLLVRARQYKSDTGAQLTATLDNQALASWTTTASNQDFTVTLPTATNASKIAFSAAAGKRVYIDYIKVEVLGATQTAVSINGFPKSVGNILTYNVEGLEADSNYVFTVQPEGNSVAVSNQVTVRTKVNTGNKNILVNNVTWTSTPEGVRIMNIPTDCKFTVFNLLGKPVQTKKSGLSDVSLKLPQKGIYLFHLQVNNDVKTFKICF